jgi:hypothetical protein
MVGLGLEFTADLGAGRRGLAARSGETRRDEVVDEAAIDRIHFLHHVPAHRDKKRFERHFVVRGLGHHRMCEGGYGGHVG